MTDPSPARELLREFILPQHRVADAEAEFPGVVSLEAITRRKVRLKVGTHIWDFRLNDSEGYDPELQLIGTPHNSKSECGQLFWDYVWHRAAEAIISVRRGHTEARMSSKKRKDLKDGNK